MYVLKGDCAKVSFKPLSATIFTHFGFWLLEGRAVLLKGRDPPRFPSSGSRIIKRSNRTNQTVRMQGDSKTPRDT